MAKQGMKRPNVTHTQPRNEQSAVPEIQGKAKHGKEKAEPIIAEQARRSKRSIITDHQKRSRFRNSTPPSIPTWDATTPKTTSPPQTCRIYKNQT